MAAHEKSSQSQGSSTELHEALPRPPNLELELLASETRFQTLFDNVYVGVLLADANSSYIDVNTSACEMFGYSRDEFIGLHASDIIAPAEQPHLDQAISETRGHDGHRREWRFRRKDGSIFSADVIAKTLPDGKLLGLIRDISDRQEVHNYRAKLAAIVESSHDGIISTDLAGIITSWNSGATKILGYEATELIGQPIAIIFPAQLLDEDRKIREMLQAGEELTQLETVRQRKDGQLIDISLSASPIRNNRGELIGTARILRDITVLKQREREIDRMTHLYDALSQVNQSIVWSKSRDELFQKVCQVLVEHGRLKMAWVGWHDTTTQQLVPISIYGDTHHYVDNIRVFVDERPEGRGPTGQAFRSGQAYVCNDLLHDPATIPWRDALQCSGFQACAAFPIRLDGRICGMINVYSEQANFFRRREIALLEEAAVDVSFALDNFAREEARQIAEKKLLHEKLFSDSIIESMPGILYFYDAAGQFLRWNRNFEAVTGYCTDEIRKMHPLNFFEGDDIARVEGRIAEVFARGESSLEAEFVTKDGRKIPYFLTGKLVAFDEFTGLIGVGVDISDRVRMESERQQRYRAEAADRIKSAFLATMSHELRTPLNSIVGFTGILLKGLAGPLNDEQLKQLDMVRTSARHLLALVNDVLDISKIEAGQLEVAWLPFAIGKSIQRVLDLVTPQAVTKRLSLHATIAPQLDQAIGDERRFEQIVLNLLSNAIKFTECGSVTLTAELLPSYTPYGTNISGRAIRLCVADTGIGISNDDLATLFQPFRQLDTGLSRKHEGTGLGLAICRRLATLMDGEIDAESEVGKGSIFRVTLPLEGRLAP